jgi:hypothetical protein
MKKLMYTFDSFLLTNNKLVVGGINRALDDLWANEIKNLIKNKKVILKRPKLDDVVLDVLDVEVINSIANKKNFFLLINNNLSPNDIVVGSEIYYE